MFSVRVECVVFYVNATDATLTGTIENRIQHSSSIENYEQFGGFKGSRSEYEDTKKFSSLKSRDDFIFEK